MVRDLKQTRAVDNKLEGQEVEIKIIIMEEIIKHKHINLLKETITIP